jgi:tRNA modification GTPase
MLVEATLDFPDEDVDALDPAGVRSRLDGIRSTIDGVLDAAVQGHILRVGLHVVLAGRPNVGKSSLLNRLAGDDVAIVTPIPGTTRDAIRETISIEGIPLHIVDTAGLREADDPVEHAGIARTRDAIQRADAIVQVVDAGAGVTAADRDIAASLPRQVPRVEVMNKIDLTGHAPALETEAERVTVWLSARTGAGVDELRRALLRIAGWHADPESVFSARERHLLALRRARGHIDVAAEGMPALELIAEELRLAQQDIASITGEFTADDLLGEIFSRFCIGK